MALSFLLALVLGVVTVGAASTDEYERAAECEEELGTRSMAASFYRGLYCAARYPPEFEQCFAKADDNLILEFTLWCFAEGEAEKFCKTQLPEYTSWLKKWSKKFRACELFREDFRSKRPTQPSTNQ